MAEESQLPKVTITPPVLAPERAQGRWLSLVLRALPLALFLWMVKSLLVPVVLGSLFALLLHPLQKKLEGKLGRAARHAPIFVTAGAIVLVVIPLVLLSIKAVSSINQLITRDWSQTIDNAQRWFDGRGAAYLERFHIRPESIRENVELLVRNAGRAAASWLGGFATAVPDHIVNAFLFTLALYYFLRDGRSFSRRMLKLSPFPQHDTEELFASISATVNGAILGMLVTAGVQGALTLIALYVFGIPGAFLLAVIATLLAVIPLVGTTPVTVGATIYLFATGRPGAAAGMLVMAVVIGISDNIVRPWVQSSRAPMHPLFTLLSIFGGLSVWGAAGIFIGPVLAAITVWIIETYTDLRLKQIARDSSMSLPPPVA